MNPTQEAIQLLAFEQGENQRGDCFLCRPAAQLLAHVGTGCYTMAGLGPLTDGYAIIATDMHGTTEEPDNPLLSEDFAKYAERVQSLLASRFGSCVLTEHGKMPICHPNGLTGSHCFHPHFLLFPGAPDPKQGFNDYFGSGGERFESLFSALKVAAQYPNYLLASTHAGEYFVFAAHYGLPRQFARVVVAEQLGKPDLASWRTHPNGEWALRNAELLRQLLEVT